MIRHFFFLLLLTCLTLPSMGQYRAAQSAAGGVASSSTYSMSLTVGEPFQGFAATSASDTLITGFYLIETPEFADTRGPRIFFTDLGGTPITPQSETPPSNFAYPANQDLAVAARITDQGSGVLEATLYYKPGGMPAFSSVALNNNGSNYSGIIAASSVSSKGVEYYVEAKDNLNNMTRSPASGVYGVRVSIDAPGLERAFTGDSTQAGYRLISVPMQLSNASSTAVLEDLGNYDTRLWRLWALKSNYADFEGEEQYQELRGGTTFSPGSAYWLISRNNWTLATGAATSVQTAQPFTMTLHAGWNFVGNPFDFSIPVQNVTLSSGTTPDIRMYNRGWQTSNSLNSFTGYAIDAGEDDNVVLSINPSTGLVGGKHDAPVTAQPHSLAWSIQIKATGEHANDHNNTIGVSSQAATGWDLLDKPEPPVIGDFVSVSFPHPDWGKIHSRYEADVRPPPVEGDVWDFDVITGSPGPIHLSFENIEDVPLKYSVELIDQVNKTTMDLRLSSTYSIRSAGPGQKYPLTIVIGESHYIEEQAESQNLYPDNFQLEQNYPNPFNPTTSIRYAVSTPSVVTLEVYNSLGQVVSTLVNQQWKDTGYHVATWNARADDGSAVSSGLYLYRLTVTSTEGAFSNPVTLTRKMMLVK